MYTANNKEYDENSEKNLAVKKYFVRKEVFASATSIISYILDQSLNDEEAPLSWGDDLDRPEILKCPYCREKLSLDSETTTVDEDIPINFDETADEGEGYQCPVCFAGYATEKDARLCHRNTHVFKCESCGTIVSKYEVDGSESFDDPQEWWIVSEWLGHKLADYGELVLRSEDDLYVWGRSKYDDELEDDDAITNICLDVKILEGQEYYREVKK